ncbi:MAG: tRNA pseudouridine(38-40) synthase TruA [gamma proteobacterium symbiont of Bathyaustriella thionipta]|nr:tRNA pseudouridine(38-40) synthase TruA [gamma proteobacterium symbiont of Bathyaustriella thionipta]
MRIALGVEYSGTAYHGWQRQRSAVSVQEKLEQALSFVAHQDIQTQCAGRTDSGVHALAQVVHFDCTARRDDRAWILGVNSKLPDDIAVRWMRPVADDFNARHSAVSRSYRYLILNRPQRSAHLAFRSSLYRWPLNVVAMQQAAQFLLGEHDFTSFRAAGCQSSTANRHVFSVAVRQQGDLIAIDICANAFLYHMVRNIAGVLLQIGGGRQSVDWVSHLLKIKDRTQAAPTAPASGLYLAEVLYADDINLPRSELSSECLLPF